MIYIVALAFILNLFLSILVIRKSYHNKVYILFSIFSFTTALWVATNVMTGVTHSLFWLKSAYAFGALVPATGLIWLLYFLNNRISKKTCLLILIVGFLFFIVSYSNQYIVVDVKEVYLGGFEGKIGSLYPLYATYMFGILIFFAIKLAIEYRKSASVKKSQLGYLLIGSLLFIITSLTASFFLPLLGIKKFIPLDSPSSLFFIGFSAYAIIRHRLMDIRLIVKRTAVYASTIIIILLLALGLYLLEMIYFKEIIPPGIWGPVVLLLGLIFFEPLKNYFEKIANKYFFAALYNYQATLEKLSKELTHSIDLDEIINSIVKTIRDTMKLDRTGILLFDEETHNYQVKNTIGFSVQNGISLVRNNFLTNYLLQKRQPVIYQELESLQSNGNGEKSEIGKLKANMKRIEASLCLPLIIKNKLIGIIVLGEKISKDAYTKEDLNLLDSLSNQAAIALENARLYQQVQDFTKTLQEKVDEQTKDIKEKNVNLKKMAKEVKEKNVHLEKLLKIQSEFLDISSHQLRTPVSVIKGVASMFAEGEMEGLPVKKRKEFYQSVYDKSVKLEKIINDILRASEFDSVKFTLNEETPQISPEEVIEEAVKEAELEAKQRKIDLIWRKPASSLPKIYAEKRYLVEAVGNLISNALKYTPSLVQVKEARSKRREKGVVMVKAEREKDNILIKVSDNGIGIPEKEIKKLFTKFARAENATEMYTDGSGLGLFIVKQIVEGHQGKVWLESKLGKGTTFYISLPIAKKMK